MPSVRALAASGIAVGVGVAVYYWLRSRKPKLLYCLNVKVCVKPEQRAEFLSTIDHDAKCTLRDEPQAVAFVIGEDKDVSNTFHFHEEYTSVEGFRAHLCTPHWQAWDAFCKTDPFTAPVEVVFYNAAAVTVSSKAAGDRDILCLNVKMRVRPERRAEFERKITADQAGTLRDEPGALAFLVGEDTVICNEFYLHEQYIGQAGFDAHLKAPHFAPWQAFVDSHPFLEPLKVSFYWKRRV
uniref:ABM domain-containing protein n=1 Tax=Prymnesium polylepis TaxID=72548 RepID=A0A7S4I089_9EUKA